SLSDHFQGRSTAACKIGNSPPLRSPGIEKVGGAMTNRLARLLVALYPRRWRERYEREFAAFLEDHRMSLLSICNVIGSALYQRLRSLAFRRSIFAQYAQSARRAVFFARYEATQFGSGMIETEHLLLGALRENGDRLSRLFADSSALSEIVADARAHLSPCKKTTLSPGLPLSSKCKRILIHSQEEAARLNDRVGVEHLLLGILREENSSASEILRRHGLQLSVLREKLAQLPR